MSRRRIYFKYTLDIPTDGLYSKIHDRHTDGRFKILNKSYERKE